MIVQALREGRPCHHHVVMAAAEVLALQCAEKGALLFSWRCKLTRLLFSPSFFFTDVCYLLKVICASVVSVRASPNTVASWA